MNNTRRLTRYNGNQEEVVAANMDSEVEETMKEMKTMEVANDVSETMNGKELVVFDHNGVLVMDSRDVAIWVGKEHKNLMRDIREYIEVLHGSAELKFEPSDYFIPSTYVDVTGRTLSCYHLTRKGCDMVAHKLTGAKGIRFTAAYINRFYEMEKKLATTTTTENFPLSQLLEMLSKSIRGIENHQAEQQKTLEEYRKMFEGQQLAIDKINQKVGQMQYV